MGNSPYSPPSALAAPAPLPFSPARRPCSRARRPCSPARRLSRTPSASFINCRNHWLVLNIPGNDVSKGEVRKGYIGSGPPKDTGLHRYTFVLYKHDQPIQAPEEPHISNTVYASRLARGRLVAHVETDTGSRSCGQCDRPQQLEGPQVCRGQPPRQPGRRQLLPRRV